MNMILAILAVITIACSMSGTTAYSQEGHVPGWVKQVAMFWGDGLISDGEFLAAIEYLLRTQIITVSMDLGGDDHVDSNSSSDATITKIARPAVVDVMPGVEFVDFVDDQLPMDGGGDLQIISDVPFVYLAKMLLGNSYADLSDQKLVYHAGLLLDRMPSAIPDSISHVDLVRHNDQYVGRNLFFGGIVHDVMDRPGNPGWQEITVYVDRINFRAEDGGGFIVANYMGPRVLPGDRVSVAGSVVGLEIRDIDDTRYTSTWRIEAGDQSMDTGAGKSDTVQTWTPVTSPHYIQVLRDPAGMSPDSLERIALQIPYDSLEQNAEILAGSVVSYQGVVKSVRTDQYGMLASFRLGVENPDPAAFDAIMFCITRASTTESCANPDSSVTSTATLLSDQNIVRLSINDIDLPYQPISCEDGSCSVIQLARYDTIQAYGMVDEAAGSSFPVVHLLYYEQ